MMEALRPLGVVQVKRSITVSVPVLADGVTWAGTFHCGRRVLAARHSVAGNRWSVDPDALCLATDIRDLDVDRHVAAVALECQRHPLSHPDALELLGQVRQPANRLAVHADDHIAG